MSYRRHTRVRRQSRYSQWFRDFVGSDLLGYWPFDDPTGSPQARDLSRNGNALDYEGSVALQQGSIVEGMAGSMRVDAVGGRAQTAGDNDLFDVPSGTAKTFLVWMNVRVDSGTILEKQSSDGGWEIYMSSSDTDNRAIFELTDSAGDVDRLFTSNDVIKTERPNFIAHGIDRNSDTNRGWVDDNFFGSGISSDVGSLENSSAFSCGARAGGSFPTAGVFQHAAAIDRLLTESEGEEIYRQGAEFFDRGRLL